MKGKDIHKPEYLDAKLELGTTVQFFSFNLDDVCIINAFIGALIALLAFLIPNYLTELFSFYMGSFVTLIVFYLKFGTND